MDKNQFEGNIIKNRSDMLLTRMMEEFQDYSMILLDTSGNIIHWNRGAELIKGYAEAEVLGKYFGIFYPQSDIEKNLPARMLQEAALSGKAVYEGWRVRKDNSRFWGSIILTALHNDQGEVIGFSKVTRDLTERKRAEDVLMKKNAELEAMNQELASFAYVASHDLQEPLRKIQTFLSRIEDIEKNKLSEKALDYFKRIQSASSRMQNLIEDLLTYSRTTTNKDSFQQVDLKEVVETVKKEMGESIAEKHAVLEVRSLPVVNGIAFQFRQLFTNLIGNSLKFSRPEVKPHIVIFSEGVSGGESGAPGGISDRNFHHITFQDNGIGFEPAYNAKVFELFQRLHGRSEYSGTGIGLSICKKIVENHGGMIKADGVPDKGAAFHIYLPR